MVTAGVPQQRSVGVDRGCGRDYKAWATFGRGTSANEAEPNFRMTDDLALGLLPTYPTASGRIWSTEPSKCQQLAFCGKWRGRSSGATFRKAHFGRTCHRRVPTGFV